MKVFAYCRVSSKGQIDGDGFDRQRDAIQKFCAEKGWSVIRWFEEPVSGTADSCDRVEYPKMIGLTGPGTSEIIVVEAAHRLARDLMISELLLEEARRDGVRIFDASSGQDLTSNDEPTRVLIRQLLAALAQWDKSNLVRRLRAARDRKRASGGHAYGVIPWEEKHQQQARHIISLTMTGYSIREIRKYLMEHKILNPRGGKHWGKSTVAEIIIRLRLKEKLPPLENQKLVNFNPLSI